MSAVVTFWPFTVANKTGALGAATGAGGVVGWVFDGEVDSVAAGFGTVVRRAPRLRWADVVIATRSRTAIIESVFAVFINCVVGLNYGGE